MKTRQADYHEMVEYLRTLDPMPQTIAAIEKPLLEKVSAHNALFGVNRMQYRETFFDNLPFRRYLNFVEKTLKKKGEWAKMTKALTETDAEETREWCWGDFLIESLNTECVCGSKKRRK